MDKRSNIGFLKKKRCPARFMLLLFSFLLFLLSLILKSNLYASLYPKRYMYPYRQEDLKIKFQHLSLDDGLSQNTINAILQDKKGFMWFGTQDGLNRFDGYEFKHYKNQPDDLHSLSNNFITSLCEDHKGILWIGTNNGGLNRFDPNTEQFTRFRHQPGNPDTLSHDVVNVIYEDQQGVLWIGTRGGLDRFTGRTETFVHYRNNPEDPKSLSNNFVRAISEDQEGNLWVGTWGGGINQLERDTQTITRYHYFRDISNPLAINRVSSLLVDTSGDIYIGTEDGLVLFNPMNGSFKRYQKSHGLGDNRINVLYKDASSPGYLWVGTEKGIYCFNPKTKSFKSFLGIPNIPRSLSEQGIFYFYNDQAGSLWFGTTMDGTYRMNSLDSQFLSYLKDMDSPDSLIDSVVNTICQDQKGILWIGTMGGLKGFDRENNQYILFRHEPENPNSLSFDEVNCICEGHGGELWIGTRGGGLDRLDRNKNHFIFTHYQHEPGSADSLTSNRIVCLCEDHTGALWIGTRSGLNRLDPDRNHFTVYRHNPNDLHSLSDDNISVIYEDRSQVLWIGTEYGVLNRFDLGAQQSKRSTTSPQTANRISGHPLVCIHEDSQGGLWIGTMGGGLIQLDVSRKHVTHFTETDGLPNNNIFAVLEDDQGNLWLSTNNGLSRFNPKTGTCKNYDRSYGLQSNEFSYGASFKSKGGEMFFGGINGLTAFYPKQIRDNPYIPPVVITDFLLFNESVPVGKGPKGESILTNSITETKTIKLSYKEYIISFQFAALNYISPGKNQYAHKMEGFEKGWNHVGKRRFAAYINLPPGEYTFRVKGTNNDGKWNKEGVSVKLIIVPPFWQTWAFRIIVLVFVVWVGYLLYQLRVRSIEKQRKKLKRMVEQRTRELEKERKAAEAANQSKSFFLARMSHEIRTPMNAVIGFADMMMDTDLTGEQQEFASNIQQSGRALLLLINDILDLSKIEAGQMTFEPINFDPGVAILDICELMAPRVEGRPVKILYRIGDRVPALVKTDPGRFQQVVLNLVGNAVKFTKRGEVEVSLDVEEEEADRLKLHTTVRDTGIGIPGDKLERIFEMFRQADGSITREYGGTGLGLPICRQIARLMGGDVWAESQLGKGSIFHFTAWAAKSAKKPARRAAPQRFTEKKEPLMTPHTLVEEARQSLRILLAEDNPVNQKLARFMLTKAGYQVDIVDNGQEAVAAYTSAPGKYDMILMDVQMPVMDGTEATKEIRRLEAKNKTDMNNQYPPHIPIIAVTANAMKGEREKLLKLGMDDYISKPISREVVFEMVKKWASS